MQGRLCRLRLTKWDVVRIISTDVAVVQVERDQLGFHGPQGVEVVFVQSGAVRGSRQFTGDLSLNLYDDPRARRRAAGRLMDAQVMSACGAPAPRRRRLAGADGARALRRRAARDRLRRTIDLLYWRTAERASADAQRCALAQGAGAGV